MLCIALHVCPTQHDMRRKHSIDIQPATSSTAGLAHLEVLADRQAQSLQALARQVTKVQLKTRLVGHDTKPLLRKVQMHCCKFMSQVWRHDANPNNRNAHPCDHRTQCCAERLCLCVHIAVAMQCEMLSQVIAPVMCNLLEIARVFVFIQVQQENLKQAEELAAQATQIAAVTADLQDTQKLLSALQSMSTALGTVISFTTSQP